MRTRLLASLFVIVMLVGAFALVGCSASDGKATESGTTSEATATAQPVLELVGGDKTVNLTFAEIQALPVLKAYGGWVTTTGKITIPTEYTAVSVLDLCDQVGGLDKTKSVSVIASDGYEMTFSFNQIKDAAFVTYDSSTGDEKKNVAGPLTLALVYARDGGPLDPTEDGQLRIAVLNAKPDSVTDGHWWVKWVSKIVVKPASDNWVLSMSGVIDDKIDRGSFESCTAPGCHGKSWTDGDGVEWTGVPLWLLMGRVDDDSKHDDDAYNDALAKTGYGIDIVAADGYKTTLDSKTVGQNDEIIVAVRMDGKNLVAEDAPLRLVGPGLSGKEMISRIVEINLIKK